MKFLRRVNFPLISDEEEMGNFRDTFFFASLQKVCILNHFNFAVLSNTQFISSEDMRKI